MMVTNWQSVSNKCKDCGVVVGDFKLEARKEGKRIHKKKIVGKPNENFGSFIKVKEKAEMECICRSCARKS